MSDPGEFIDEALRRESSWIRAEEAQTRLGKGLRYYGTSIGAIRGTVRDTLRRYAQLTHDEVTALSSELWEPAIFERRFAAIVLLQSNVHLLTNTDLTRLEGFVREGRLRELVDPLAVDVIGPLIAGLEGQARARAGSVLDRWVRERDEWLCRAALMSPLRELRAGGGDWDAFVRHATTGLDAAQAGGEAEVIREAISAVLAEVSKRRPELQFPSSVA
ncbi:DNA alkylation repair protein [Arthrobacter sp. FW306-04-A]|uniref:DNA alkylation repair protein n=1 Tax=Arthrobacter sp. FW306-04-A TaxID=2879619 RepID=UPI0037BE9C9F|nr:DNA alkylation repair protein [Arthrobacter sp. FW306-04-A]